MNEWMGRLVSRCGVTMVNSPSNDGGLTGVIRLLIFNRTTIIYEWMWMWI